MTTCLLEQTQRDTAAVEELLEYSKRPEYLTLMRRIVDATDGEFERDREKLLLMAADPYLRGVMKRIVLDAEEELRRAGQASRKPNGLTTAVWKQIRNFHAARVFTARDLLPLLKADGYEFVARLPRQAVFYALRSLQQSGQVMVEFQSPFRSTNYYRLAFLEPQPGLYDREVPQGE